MQIDILTTLPSMFTGPLTESMMKRAQDKKLAEIRIHDLRQWTQDKHRSTDDHPYGGGPGMVMMIEPIDKALQSFKAKKGTKQELIILTSAKGNVYTQQTAQTWSTSIKRLVIICGHYEGVDERVAQYLVDQEVRIGNYVLTGGELPAMVMIDSIVRLIPGVLGDHESVKNESHTILGYLEYPQYTRPENYNGWEVPQVLLGGNHKAIEDWRKNPTLNKSF
ncbi:MAG: tRNA (guanosine(37)-N1)-methyltransferase TrmD [Candidatus Pacebacteria bacterium]|nr:tRNA (guanosine(37)-N1)-methyltransferase TrmD [Candidatus Paceibacterota bacterium]